MTTAASPAVAGRYYRFELCDRLRRARELANFSQAELAERSGVSIKSIQRYEYGVSSPRRPQLAAIALATGFDVDWLLTGAEPGDGGGKETTAQYLDIPAGQVTDLALFARSLPPMFGVADNFGQAA